jgi:hypothetical protein
MLYDYVQMNLYGKRKLIIVYVLVVHLMKFLIRYVLKKTFELLNEVFRMQQLLFHYLRHMLLQENIL